MAGVHRTVRRRGEALFETSGVEVEMKWFYALMIVLLVVMGAAALIVATQYLPGAINDGDRSFLSFLVFTYIVGIFFVGYGLSMGYYLIARVNLIVYPDGFYQGVLTPDHLFSRTVPIWSWDQVKNVTMQRTVYNITSYSRLMIVRKDGVTNKVPPNPDILESMKWLARMVPDRCDNTIREFLIDSDDFRYHPDPTGMFSRHKQQHWLIIIVIIGFGSIAFSILTALPVFISLYLTIWTSSSMFGSLVIAGLCLLVTGFMIPILRRWHQKRVMYGAEVTADGTLRLKKSLFDKLFMDTRSEVPITQIVGLKRKIYPLSFSEYSVVKMNDGQTYETEIDLFKWAATHGNFSRSGDKVMNRRVRKANKQKVTRFSRDKLAIWCGALLVLFTIFFTVFLIYAVTAPLMGMGLFYTIQSVVFLLLFVSGPVLIVYTLYYIQKSRRLNYSTVVLEPGGMVITDHEGSRVSLKSSDILHVEMVQGRILKHTLVRTLKGNFELHMECYDILKYHHENGGKLPAPGIRSSSDKYKMAGMLSFLNDARKQEEVGGHGASGARRIRISGTLMDSIRTKDASAPRKNVKGKGKLLLEEDLASHKLRRKGLVTTGINWILVAMMVGLPALLVIPLTGDHFTHSMAIFWAATTVVGIGAYGLWHIMLGTEVGRLKFYESGLMVKWPLVKEPVFMPYGRFATVTEGKKGKMGNFYELMPNDPTVVKVRVLKSMKGSDRMISMVRRRVGDPDLLDAPDEGFSDMREWRMAMEAWVFPLIILTLAPLLFMLTVYMFDTRTIMESMLKPIGIVFGGIFAGYASVGILALALVIMDVRSSVGGKSRLLPVGLVSSNIVLVAAAALAGSFCAGYTPTLEGVTWFALVPFIAGSIMIVAQGSLLAWVLLERWKRKGVGMKELAGSRQARSISFYLRGQ